MAEKMNLSATAGGRVTLPPRLAEIAELKAAATDGDLAGYVHQLVKRDVSRTVKAAKTTRSDRVQS